MNCPFVYKNGKRCDGHISKIRPVVLISLTANNKIAEVTVDSLYPVYLYCSKKGTHSRFAGRRSKQMTAWFDDLPTEIRQKLQDTHKLKIPEKLKCRVCGSKKGAYPRPPGDPHILCERCAKVNWYLDKTYCDSIYDEEEQRELYDSVKRVFVKKHGYTEEEMDRILKGLLWYEWLHR